MQHLIELHGGSVRAEHGAEGGARFVLTLPMQGLTRRRSPGEPRAALAGC